MYGYTRIPPGQYWSDCSRRQMNKHFKAGKGRCIENKPDINIASKSKCGNLIVEEGEECDCGDITQCKNKCCDAKTCKLKPLAKCAHGGCCHDCQPAPRGMNCRKPKDECDIVDTCDGKSATCTNLY